MVVGGGVCSQEETVVTLGKVVNLVVDSCSYLASGDNTDTKNCGKL